MGEGAIKTSPNYKCAEELAWRKWEDYMLEELGSSSKMSSLKGMMAPLELISFQIENKNSSPFLMVVQGTPCLRSRVGIPGHRGR